MSGDMVAGIVEVVIATVIAAVLGPMFLRHGERTRRREREDFEESLAQRRRMAAGIADPPRHTSMTPSPTPSWPTSPPPPSRAPHDRRYPRDPEDLTPTQVKDILNIADGEV